MAVPEHEAAPAPTPSAAPPPVPVPTPSESSAATAAEEAVGGVRLVMEDGTAVELPAGTAQARAFTAVAEVLTAGLPGSSQATNRR